MLKAFITGGILQQEGGTLPLVYISSCLMIFDMNVMVIKVIYDSFLQLFHRCIYVGRVIFCPVAHHSSLQLKKPNHFDLDIICPLGDNSERAGFRLSSASFSGLITFA